MHARYWDKFEPNIPQRTRDPDDIEQSILDGVREIEAIEKGGFHVCVCVCARAHMHACVRVRVRASCVRACVSTYVRACVRARVGFCVCT